MRTPGSSEIAVILGCQRQRADGEPYTSAVELWARLTGLIVRYDSNSGPDAECGKWFEPAVLNRYAAERRLVWGTDFWPGPTLDQPGATAEGVPWHARWDAFNGRDNRAVEAKCPRVLDAERWGPAGSDQVPVEYAVQVAAQLAVAHRLWGTEWGDLAAFARAPGWGDDRVWAVYHLRRDPRVEQDVLDAVHRWLEVHVEHGNPPEPDGSASAADTLRRIWAPADERVLTAGPAELELYRRYLQCRTARDEVAGRMEEARQRLQLVMADATELLGPDGRPIATWRTDKTGRRRFRFIHHDEFFEEAA